jgi:hypothetical protein
MSAGVGGMDELLPLVKQLTDPDQVCVRYICKRKAKQNDDFVFQLPTDTKSVACC